MLLLPPRTVAVHSRPGDTLHRALFVLWVTFMGADRIDLAGGRAGFTLTPFLALTPIVVVSELIRRHAWRRQIMLPRITLVFITLVLALLAVVVASVFVSLETATAASRACLLVALIFGSLAVVLGAGDREDVLPLLAKGAAYGLLVFLAFDLMEFAAWFTNSANDAVHLGPVNILLETSAYAGIFPRLCGQVVDPNRAGFLVVFYAYVVGKGERRASRRRWLLGLSIFLLVLALSRSAIVASLAAAVIAVLERGQFRAHPATWFAGALALAGLCVFLLLAPAVAARIGTTLVPFTQRLSTAEGSAQTHVELLSRGIHEATESIPRALLGLGFGSSYTVLQDVFPGNRYGNFHSLYVSMFAESGVFALILTLALLIVPMVLGGPYLPLIGAAIVFNVFYQATAEPAFWVSLVLAWLPLRAPSRLRLSRPARRARAEPRLGASGA